MSNTALPHEAHVELSEITENIYVGTSMCCDKHKGYHQGRLKDLGIYADIDLREEYDEPTSHVGAHLRLPVMDTYPPSPLQTKIGVDLIDSLVKDNKKVYIHCQVGHGRSPTLAAAYFILKEGMKAEDAVAKIKKARPEAHPTDRQLEFLKSLELSNK
jgi:protein-tyrosine phosphatase